MLIIQSRSWESQRCRLQILPPPSPTERAPLARSTGTLVPTCACATRCERSSFLSIARLRNWSSRRDSLGGGGADVGGRERGSGGVREGGRGASKTQP